MNFFQRQAQARSQSRLLMCAFLFAVAGVILAVDAGVVFALMIFDSRYARGGFIAQAQLYTPVLWVVSLLVGGAIALASLYKTMQLRSGGAAVALSIGAERVRVDTNDAARRRLRNVVEEMAIAAGVPMPDTYVLEREAGINAFAAGHTPANAAIVVTRGMLEHLDRPELQGVIAHEFSHILNGDIRLNVRMVGLLFGIQSLSIAGRKMMHLTLASDSDDERVAIPVWVAGFALRAIGWLGFLFGRLIQAAVSRHRERLADASAVQFTRDTHGLRNALVKIGALQIGSRIVDSDTEAVAHMLFAAGSGLATHPPLIERIRSLDPLFKASEFDLVRKQLVAQLAVDEAARPKPVSSTPSKASAAEKLDSLLTTTIAVTPTQVERMVGNPGAGQLDWAQVLRVSLPDSIKLASADAKTATGFLLALTLEDDAATQARQQAFISTQLGEQIGNSVAYWLPHVQALNPAQRQPALLRLMPVLRQQARADRLALLACLNGLLQREGVVRLQNYTLRKLAQVSLLEGMTPAALPGRAPLTMFADELALLFAVVAQAGNPDGLQARQAYHAGLDDLLSRTRTEFAQQHHWSRPLDLALTKLDRLSPFAKEKLVQALVKTIAYDSRLAIEEVELLRAICATLHCPLPPLWEESTSMTLS